LKYKTIKQANEEAELVFAGLLVLLFDFKKEAVRSSEKPVNLY
jgi:hypothetical protein